MSLEKAIKSGKVKREPYRKGKSVSARCRNHGGCTWCLGNRQYHDKKETDKANSSNND